MPSQRRSHPTAQIKRERDLQAWIVDLVKSDTLSDHIDGADAIERIVVAGRDQTKLPIFTIDRFTRERYAESADIALSSLTLLEYITGDKDISRTSGEELRPDVVAYNPEQETIVVFELKKSSQTGRQALTELLAYEHELQNHVPLLGRTNIVFVLISSEWSTLMDHAITGAITWAGKTCIGLEVHDSAAGRRLRVRVRDSWEPLLSYNLPRGSLSTATLCLYSNAENARTAGEEEEGTSAERAADTTLRELETALELIARDGERAGLHGFAILCDSAFSYCPWMILVGVLNPYAFLSHSLETAASRTDTDVFKFFADPTRGYLETSLDSSIGRVVERADRYLSESFNPVLEGFLDWSTARTQIRSLGFPIRMEFWGVLGEFAREYVLHEGVRDTQMTTLRRTKLDWRTPIVGLSVLTELTKERPFLQGIARPSDCFKFGVLIGNVMLAYSNIDDSDSHNVNWDILIEWLESELVIAVTEVVMMYHAAADLSSPPPLLLIGGGHSAERKLHSVEEFIAWFVKDFIGRQEVIARQLFASGIEASSLFDPVLREWLTPEQEHELRDRMTTMLQMVATSCILRFRDLGDPRSLSISGRGRIKILQRTLGLARMDLRRLRVDTLMSRLQQADFGTLVDYVEGILLPLADELIDPVFHRLHSVQPVAVDWEYLRQGIERAPTGPNQIAAVILEPDGTLTTGVVDVPFMMTLDDPEREVFFMNRGLGFAVVRKTDWDSLYAGDLGLAPKDGHSGAVPDRN